MTARFEIRGLGREELARVAEIDRTERIELLYTQEGEHLAEQHGTWDAAPWRQEPDGEHSLGAIVRELHAYLDAGGVALGAFDGGALIGIGVVVPHLRTSLAQLAFLHVTATWRGRGVGVRLAAELDHIARAAGATEMVVSATPTGNTVAFYRGRGFAPMREPIAELFEREPEDVHMHKML